MSKIYNIDNQYYRIRQHMQVFYTILDYCKLFLHLLHVIHVIHSHGLNTVLL